MTPNIILLEARLRKELFQLENLEKELKTLAKIKDLKVESIRLRAYASILHDFYSGIEKIFINIAREIDETVPKAEGWHRQLLEQMTLDISVRRPPVVDANLAAQLQQYLSFRHRFRNLYGFELEWARMEELVKNLGITLKMLKNNIENLLVFLQDVM
ncbi:MAG: hypothetical protein A4E55_01271 [Pelotomaculum sp. PtaU1.Bin035]|nr:MAG: hypothetical protein A4E55_01271 [Pelotomaculum sp. PtaU1.Bin035]